MWLLEWEENFFCSEFLISFNDPATTFFFNLILFHHNVTFYLIIILVSVYWVLTQIIRDQKYDIFPNASPQRYIWDFIWMNIFYKSFLYTFEFFLTFCTAWKGFNFFPIEVFFNKKHILYKYIKWSSIVLYLYLIFFFFCVGHSSFCSFNTNYYLTLRKSLDGFAHPRFAHIFQRKSWFSNIKFMCDYLDNVLVNTLWYKYRDNKVLNFPFNELMFTSDMRPLGDYVGFDDFLLYSCFSENFNVFGQWMDFEEIVLIDLFRVYRLNDSLLQHVVFNFWPEKTSLLFPRIVMHREWRYPFSAWYFSSKIKAFSSLYKYLYSSKNNLIISGAPVNHNIFFEKRLSHFFSCSLNTLGVYEILDIFIDNIFEKSQYDYFFHKQLRSVHLHHIREFKYLLFILKTFSHDLLLQV